MENVFDLKIGFKCNNNCIHCVVADKRPTEDLSIEEIKNIIDKLPSHSVLQITGGEPTLYGEKLLDILKYSYGLNKSIKNIIQSNTTGFADIEFCKKCAPYIDQVHVAIHSSHPEIHNDIVSCKDNTMWDKTIQGWDNLINNNVYCTTQTVLSKKNIATLEDTYDFIQKRHPGTHMSMTYPHLMGNAWSNRDMVAFRYSDYKDVIQNCLKKYQNLLFTESIPYCYQYPYLDALSAEDLLVDAYKNNRNNRLGIDPSSSRKDSMNYNFLDLKERRKAPLCRECIFNDYCPGVWKEYIEIFKDNLDLFPIKEKGSL